MLLIPQVVAGFDNGPARRCRDEGHMLEQYRQEPADPPVMGIQRTIENVVRRTHQVANLVERLSHLRSGNAGEHGVAQLLVGECRIEHDHACIRQRGRRGIQVL